LSKAKNLVTLKVTISYPNMEEWVRVGKSTIILRMHVLTSAPPPNSQHLPPPMSKHVLCQTVVQRDLVASIIIIEQGVHALLILL
jgi:hypothetical protein